MKNSTPGPWEVAEEDNYEREGIPVFARNRNGMPYYIAICRYMGTADVAPAAANARLIAAAPALLEALEVAVATIERLEVKHNGFSSCSGTLDIASAALAQAKGEKG